VAGEQEVVAVIGEPVEHQWFGRVQYCEPEVGGRIRRAGDLLIAIARNVRVMYAADLDVMLADLDAAASVVASIQPALSMPSPSSAHGRSGV
jgi:hypothetical protein